MRGTLYYLAPGVLVVGGTSLTERRREAPKSLDELELIEASANVRRGECVCVRVLEGLSPSSVLPSPLL